MNASTMRVLSGAEIDAVIGGADLTVLVYVKQPDGSYKGVWMSPLDAALYKASLDLMI